MSELKEDIPQIQEPVAQEKQQGTQSNEIEKEQSKQNTNSSQEDGTKEIEKMMNEMQIQEKKANKEGKNDSTKKDNGDENFKSSQNQVLDETKYFVDINKTNISFGKNILFPGSIEEVDVAIGLKEDLLQDNENGNPLMLRVIAKCSNNEFDALDEYVFSVRSNERFQYFEEVRFKIRKKEKALVKVAVKIPPVKQNYTISGVLEIQLESLEPVCLPITAKCEIPEIICIKDLYKVDEQCHMIKVPAKKNQIRMPPIPFKNLSNFSFTLQVQAITNQNFSNRPYDIVTQNFVNCPANTQFFVNIQLKQNMNYKGIMPARDTIRKVLLLKIKNSTVFFNYPIEVYVFESNNAGGVN